MKRRTFIKAIFGVLASVYAPLSLFHAETEAYDPLDLDIGKLRAMGCPASLIKRVEIYQQQAMEQVAEIMEEYFWGQPSAGQLSGIPYYTVT